MARPWSQEWNTCDELEFVRGLGGYNPTHMTMTRTRQDWLLAYHETMCKREEWGNIDRQVVGKAVEKEIHALQRRKTA